MFILMAYFTASSGLARDLYNAAAAWLSHIRGGLAIATVFACGIFGAKSLGGMGGVSFGSQLVGTVIGSGSTLNLDGGDEIAGRAQRPPADDGARDTPRVFECLGVVAAAEFQTVSAAPVAADGVPGSHEFLRHVGAVAAPLITIVSVVLVMAT